MSTRGTVRILGERYFMQSDAYPSFAKKVLLKALKKSDTRAGIVRASNKEAGFDWLSKMKKGEQFGYPFEEYRWIVNTRDKTVKLDKEYQKRIDKRFKEFNKKLREGKIGNL